jgi:Uncharacterized protein conserved in bacteria (DUF2219)
MSVGRVAAFLFWLTFIQAGPVHGRQSPEDTAPRDGFDPRRGRPAGDERRPPVDELPTFNMAAIPERSFSGVSGAMDQDWLFLGAKYNQDRNYTMGVALTLSGKFATISPLDRVHEKLLPERFKRSRLDALRTSRSHSVTLGSGGFTPDDLQSEQRIPNDRPYSSLLFISFSTATFEQALNFQFRTELTVGMLGLRLAERLQTRIHQARGDGEVRSYDPKGWPNQISDGGEPTFRYVAAVQVGGHDENWSRYLKSRWYDVNAYAEASVGYYTNAAVGPIIRVGRIRSHATAMSTNPISSGNQLLGTDRPRVRSEGPSSAWKPRYDREDFELFFYAAGRGRLVVYNALLNGQILTDSAARLSWGETRHLVAEGEFGLALGGWGLTATLAMLAGRTPEYSFPGTERRRHTWGGIYVTYRLPETM